MPFEIKAIDRSLHVNLQGSVDLSLTNSLKTEFEQLMSSDIQVVRVDAGSLDYIDSSGVAALLFMKKLCTRFNAKFAVTHISEAAFRVVSLAKLDAMLGVSATSLGASTMPLGGTSNAFDGGQATKAQAPSFSDADALAIFQNDSPLVGAPAAPATNAGTFEIKPGSFS